MLNRKITLLLVIIFPYFVFSQNFVKTWQQCYGGSEHDKVRSIIPYKDGYLFFGSTESTDGDITSNPIEGAAWLVNIGSSGDIVFDKCFNGFGSHANGFKIINIDSNSYYLLGDTGPNNYSNSNGYWVARIDSNLNIIWQDVLGGSYLEAPTGGCIAHDGGIIEIGITSSIDGDIEEHFGYFDNWAVKLNHDGSRDWVKTYGNSSSEDGGKIIPTSDGGYIFTAHGINYDYGNIYCNGHDNSYYDAWLIKINATGEIDWNQCYGGSSLDALKDIIELDDGYIALGLSLSNDGDLTGHYGMPDDAADIWVVRFDLFGNIVWSKNYGGTDWDWGERILQNNDGSYIIFGGTKSHNYDVQGNTAPSNEPIVWMLKIDDNGELLYQKPFDNLLSVSDFPDFIKISDYKYIAAVTKRFGGCHGWYNEDIYVFEIQDMDEFIPSQPIGTGSVCLGVETESYYTTNLVVDTMETQWLLEPEESGSITNMHDSVLILWNNEFYDTAYLKVKSINIYGESSYSVAKEIIVYPALDLSEISGADSVCVNNQSIYTTTNPQAYELTWQLSPLEAGNIINQQDTAFISWNSQYTGMVTLNTSSHNPCGQDEYSPIKNIKLKNCTGIDIPNYPSLQVYPNPAKNYIIFKLPQNTKNSILIISDIYGKNIKELSIKGQTQIQWDCQNTASGVYFYHTEISGIIYRGRIVINK